MLANTGDQRPHKAANPQTGLCERLQPLTTKTTVVYKYKIDVQF